jgi:hypothetical protein
LYEQQFISINRARFKCRKKISFPVRSTAVDSLFDDDIVELRPQGDLIATRVAEFGVTRIARVAGVTKSKEGMKDIFFELSLKGAGFEW